MCFPMNFFLGGFIQVGTVHAERKAESVLKTNNGFFRVFGKEQKNGDSYDG